VIASWAELLGPGHEQLRVDPRLIDPGGPAATVSLVMPPHTIPFDDPAVQQARRDLLALADPFDAVTTIMRDDSTFCGSLLVARGSGAAARLRADPFARIAPARIVEVAAGVIAAKVPWPAGPVIERYGSAQPWPADRFA
jgi:hypothetical protein